MSPSSLRLSRRVVIILEGDRTRVVQFSRSWRPLASSASTVILPHAMGEGADAVQALPGIIGSTGVPARLEVIVAGHRGHFAVLPASGNLRSESERAALARHIFERQYGDLARDWSLLASPSSADEATLAWGVSTALLEVLRQKLQPLGRIVSIRPALMDVFNAIRGSLGKGIEYLALAEPGRLTLAEFHHGAWQSVVSRAIAEDRDALGHLLEERITLYGQANRSTLWLHDPGGRLNLPTDPVWSCRSISPIALLEPTAARDALPEAA